MEWNVGGFLAFPEMLINELNAVGHLKPFSSVYDGPICIFDGGRAKSTYTTAVDTTHIENVEKYVQLFNSLQCSCLFTMSAYNIHEEDLSDKYCNLLLEVLSSNNENGVIVSSDLLASYIRSMYPSLKLTASVTKPAIECNYVTDDADYYNHLLDTYDKVVVNSAYSFEPGLKLFRSLSDLSRVEVLANGDCLRNCPFAREHYLQTGEVNRLIARGLPAENIAEKYYNKCAKLRSLPNATQMLTNKDVLRLNSIGINHFKLQGREMPSCIMKREIDYYLHYKERGVIVMPPDWNGHYV